MAQDLKRFFYIQAQKRKTFRDTATMTEIKSCMCGNKYNGVKVSSDDIGVALARIEYGKK